MRTLTISVHGSSRAWLRVAGRASGLALLLWAGLTACSGTADSAACPASQAEPTGPARRVVDVPIGATPGPIFIAASPAPVALAAETSPGSESGAEESSGASRATAATGGARSLRLWVDAQRDQIVVAHRGALVEIGLESFAVTRARPVAREAGALVPAPSGQQVLLTDRIAGHLVLVDLQGEAAPVRVAVGPGPNDVVLGPGGRLAYVAGEIGQSLTLVDTGQGVPVQDDRRVLVSTLGQGLLLALDRDGRERARYQGLPSRPRDLVLLPDGRRLLGSYSDLVTTGDPGTLGDGDLSLDEGVFCLDLQTGKVSRWSLRPNAPEGRTLGRPTGLTLLPGGDAVAVAVPGWQRIFVLATGLQPPPTREAGAAEAPAGQGSAPRPGALLSEIQVPGEPTWLAAGARAADWLYVYDPRGATVRALDRRGQVTAEAALP